MNYVSEALERLQERREFLSSAILGRRVGNYRFPPPEVVPAERFQWRTDLAALNRATPFYWNARTTEIVRALAPSFNLDEIRCTRNLFYCDVGWAYFGETSPFEIKIKVHERDRNRAEVAGFALDALAPVKAICWYIFGAQNRPYLGATAWAPHNQIEETREWLMSEIIPMLWISTALDEPMSSQLTGDELTFRGIEDDRTEYEVRCLKQFLVASGTFLRQNFLSAAPTPPERHARKRMERAGYEPRPISVIQLRKTERTALGRAGEPAAVDWACQWTVGGHVRQQWYPSLGEHLPVYIHPYIKGPEGKPLKPRTTPIYSVTR